MDDRPSSRTPADAGVQILTDDPAWRRAVRNPEAIVRRAAEIAGAHATIVLASDRVVRTLNARHRGIEKPTNVLTFEPLAQGQPGEIILALGTIRREARAARKRLSDHLAHLVIHGSLHLQGHDHHSAGEAGRMEQTEARLMGRLKRPNPWKPT
jgi:probable rRNA maturation factor